MNQARGNSAARKNEYSSSFGYRVTLSNRLIIFKEQSTGPEIRKINPSFTKPEPKEKYPYDYGVKNMISTNILNSSQPIGTNYKYQ
jgi:hypothetical protein